MSDANAPSKPDLGSRPEPAATPARSARVPIRRRAMPCPHCDVELPRELASLPRPTCPACGLSLAPVEVAGFLRRCAAALVDGLLITIVAGPLAWGLHRLIDPMPLSESARGLDRLLTLASADFDLLLGRAGPFLVMYGLYYLLMVFLAGRTIGQRLLAMRIVDRQGERPGLGVALVRAVAQVVGTLAAALGLVWAALDSEKRAFHDLVAGTYVVRSA